MFVSIDGLAVEIKADGLCYGATYADFLSDGGQALRDGVMSYSFDGVRTYKNSRLSSADSYAEKVVGQLPSLLAAQEVRENAMKAAGAAEIADSSAAAYAEKQASRTLDEIEADLKNAVQDWMDTQAQARGYDSVFTAISYKTSSVKRWAEDAALAEAWRDAVWVCCNRLLKQYRAGEIGILTAPEVIKRLPAVEWSSEPDPE